MGRYEEDKKNRAKISCPVTLRLGAFQVSSTSPMCPLGVSAPPKKLKRTRSPGFPHQYPKLQSAA
jgi:hypothetical protein